MKSVGNTNPSGRGMNGNVFDSDYLCPTLTTNKGEGIKILIKNATKKGYLIADDGDGIDTAYLKTSTRAWLDGFEIEQEKLYTVQIPNPNNEYSMNALIRLPSSGKIALVALHKPNTSYLKNKEYQLTESEIKQDFEWAFQFAEEVEEEE